MLEDEGSDIEDLDPIYKDSTYEPSPAPNFLKYRFIHFHRCLNRATKDLQSERTGTVIVFSDSAFFESEAPTHILSIARRLMVDLLTHKVPARMGIAHGSFRWLRYMNDVSTQAIFHVSQFLGTAVSRAVGAEKASSGMRIFIHPTFENHWDESQGRLALPEPENPKKRECALSELNYLGQLYAIERVEKRDPSILDNNLHHWLTEMADTVEEPDVYRHYNETYAAWNRMRVQAQFPQFGWQEFPWR